MRGEVESRAIQKIKVVKALADESRLRILSVLRSGALSVNELLEVMEMGQSRVSRHLKILAEAGIIYGLRDGVRVYYGYNENNNQQLRALLKSLNLGVNTSIDVYKDFSEPIEFILDGRRLAKVVAKRRQASLEHFQKHGLKQESEQKGLVDAAYYRRKVMSFLPPAVQTVVDLGSGQGVLTRQLAEQAAKTICVDQSGNMLESVHSQLPAADCRLGNLEHLPLGDGEADVVIAAMVLHHLPEPDYGLAEIARVTRPGGILILAELERHNEEAMRARFADFWLGFVPEQLKRKIESVGFKVVDRDEGAGAGELNCFFFRAVRQ